jgi:propionate CoA-transferase
MHGCLVSCEDGAGAATGREDRAGAAAGEARMSVARVLNAEEAAALIPDRAVVAISSSSGLNTPERVLRAIGERFEREGRPQGLSTLHPIGTGDMYGIKGVDHLARPGLLARVIAGSYPSRPSSMPAPRIWRMIQENAVAAYNLPSGLIFDMLRDVAAKRAGVLTRTGLDTFVDPRREGGRMNPAAKDAIVQLVELGGKEWLHIKNIPPDVAIIRGTTADERGNISMEHEAAPLGTLDLALAARNSGGLVIAQVKRLVPAGAIATREVHVPCSLVDVVVVDPEQMQATGTRYDPALSGEVRVDLDTLDGVPFGPEKVIARRAAMALAQGDVAALGFGVSALVPRILIEEGLHGEVTWTIEQGPVGGVPVTGFPFGCAVNADAIIASPQQFTFFQGGGFDCAFLSFLQIDAAGNVNVSKLAKRPYLTAGVGGFIDITAHGPRLVFSGTFTTGGLELSIEDGLRIVTEGKVRKLVAEVEQVSFSGARAREQGQEVTIVTERCVLRRTDAGLEVVEIAPGIDLECDVLGQASIPLRVSADLARMDVRLFRPEPIGLELAPPRRHGRWS